MDEKRRRPFKVYRKKDVSQFKSTAHIVAKGLLYDEGNVQVLWREGIGYTAEQYDSIAQVFGIVEGANTITIEEETNVT